MKISTTRKLETRKSNVKEPTKLKDWRYKKKNQDPKTFEPKGILDPKNPPPRKPRTQISHDPERPKLKDLRD